MSDKFVGTPIKEIALSLREEELSGPVAGSYSEDGSGADEEEF